MKGIYEFYLDCGRSGSLDGIFVADSDDLAKMYGHEVYFGECLGKHSEVSSIINEGHIELKTDDQAFISWFESIFGEDYESGFNPLSYYEPSEDDEEDNDSSYDDDLEDEE